MGLSYLYGGVGEEEGSIGFDDIYVLSIPTFTWVRLYPPDRKGTGDFPHHSLTCNVVNEAQMIVHGGFFPLTDECDDKVRWGLHNMDMSKQNKDKSYWAEYEPDKKTYVVPDDIIKVVGGKSDGRATKNTPKDGFMHRDLKALMTRKAEVASRSPTRNVGSSTAEPASDSDTGPVLSTGAIAGIAVGGAAVVVAIVVGCFLLWRRRRSTKPGSATTQPMSQQFNGYNQNVSHQSGSSNPYSATWSPHGGSYAPSSPPPLFNSRPGTVSHHQQPPVELSASDISQTPMAVPYPPPPDAGMVEPKMDSYGNVWYPQTSVMQTPSDYGHGAISPHSNGTSPQGGHSSPAISPAKDDASTYFHRRRPTPQELATEAERQHAAFRQSPAHHHNTYYNP